MIGKWTKTLLFVALSVACTTSAWAVEIVYNEEGRPLEFHGVVIDGQPWYVTVTWTGSMRETYGASGSFIAPEYWGDSAGATVAAQALRQALIDDGFSMIAPKSYVWMPVSKSGWYSGPGVWLHTESLDIKPVAVYYDNYYGTVGFTQFHLFKDGFEGSDNTSQ